MDQPPPTSANTNSGASEQPCVYENLGILDFEATCTDGEDKEGWDSKLQEIIELPVTLVRAATGEIVDRFATVVRPTLQPQLTRFCRELTHISQAEVDAAPDIEQAFISLLTWLDSHQVTAANTLLITCGDWDLKAMWPRQVSLNPALETPRLFQQWCNLKVVCSERIGRRATGMLGMLEALNLEHHGHHHRGADDVANLTRVVQRLLADGATFRCTWQDANRQAELNYWRAKLKKAETTIQHQERALVRLKPTDSAFERTQEQLANARLHAERVQRTVRAFQVPSPE